MPIYVCYLKEYSLFHFFSTKEKAIEWAADVNYDIFDWDDSIARDYIVDGGWSQGIEDYAKYVDCNRNRFYGISEIDLELLEVMDADEFIERLDNLNYDYPT